MKTLLAILCLGAFASCETEYTTRTYSTDYSDEAVATPTYEVAPSYGYRYYETPTYYSSPYYSQYDYPYYSSNRTKVVVRTGDREDRDDHNRHGQRREYHRYHQAPVDR